MKRTASERTTIESIPCVEENAPTVEEVAELVGSLEEIAGVSAKRQRPEKGEIGDAFYTKAEEIFKSDPTNMMAQNAVSCVGAQNATLDNEEANKVTHIFLNTLKPEHLRATNQESSGRCWMFAGLNVYRYLLIRALNLENFEFSETYLFFYDKLERANYLLQYFIDHPEAHPEDREANIMLTQYYGDGGYYNYFSNLINKYGLVPKDCMEETYHSGYTTEMNEILNERIIACVNKINQNHSQKRPNKELMQRHKDETMQMVYNCLVKFLGQPPKTFRWFFKDAEHNSHVISGLTPQKFYGMVKSVDSKDMAILVNIPGKEYYKMYTVKNCNNMVGGLNCSLLNVPMYEISKYSAISIERGIPVWFAGDVSKGFGYHKSALSEELYNTDLFFGKPLNWNKSDKVKFGFTQGNHAMTITGVNVDERGKPDRWQVENSWGYYDHELPGLDGFMSMSNKWFEDNLVQVAIHKEFLSRRLKGILEQESIVLEPWDYMAPAIKVKSIKKPEVKKKF